MRSRVAKWAYSVARNLVLDNPVQLNPNKTSPMNEQPFNPMPSVHLIGRATRSCVLDVHDVPSLVSAVPN